MSNKTLPAKQLFAIPETGRWIEVGVAWENRDGSLNLQLSIPIAPGTKLQLRDYQPRKRRGSEDTALQSETHVE